MISQLTNKKLSIGFYPGIYCVQIFSILFLLACSFNNVSAGNYLFSDRYFWHSNADSILRNDNDSLKLKYYEKYTDRIILSLSYSESEIDHDINKLNAPDTSSFREKQSSFIGGSSFLGFSINFWKLSYSLGFSDDGGYMVYDGTLETRTRNHSVGLSFNKLSISPSYHSFSSIITNDSTGQISRSLKDAGYSIGFKYKLLNRYYTDMIFNNSYRQKKSTFSISLLVTPFYRVMTPFSVTDSMFNTMHIPVFGNLTGIEKIEQAGMNNKIYFSFNLIFWKNFFIAGSIGQGVVTAKSKITAKESAAESTMLKTYNTGDYAGALGFDNKKLFIKLIFQMSYVNNILKDFSIYEYESYASLKLGYRFNRPDGFLDNLKY
jgi:hypothetical protein